MLTFRQVAPFVPIYDILDGQWDVGALTNFPGEGPMATVRYGDDTRTVSGATLADCEAAAIAAFIDMGMVDEPEIEDEDGSIAYARMREQQAEYWAMQDEGWAY